MPVTFQGELAEGTFLRRPNRFVLWAEVAGEPVKAHLPTPGRMGEFLHQGTPFLLRKRPDARPDQATEWSVVAGWHNQRWVVVDSTCANALVQEGLNSGRLAEHFPDADTVATEPRTETGRFDLSISGPRGQELVEIKSVTLLDDGDGRTGRFPDAPTERGRRHVDELAKLARGGRRCTVLFVALRDDIQRIVPNHATDPAFAEALAKAQEAGVRLLAWGSRLEGRTLRLTEPIPVNVDP